MSQLEIRCFRRSPNCSCQQVRNGHFRSFQSILNNQGVTQTIVECMFYMWVLVNVFKFFHSITICDFMTFDIYMLSCPLLIICTSIGMVYILGHISSMLLCTDSLGWYKFKDLNQVKKYGNLHLGYSNF